MAVLIVAKSLADNPEFTKAGFHIGRFVTATIDTKVDRANIKALYSNLEFALTCIIVSISNSLTGPSLLGSDSLSYIEID
jgi:hypothetical protein